MAEQLVMRGTLVGHSGWVTSLATSLEKYEPEGLVSGVKKLLTAQIAQTCFSLDLVTSL